VDDAGPDASPDASPDVRTEREGVTRRAILGAARRLFTEQGYGRTSIRQLATAAGVAPRTIYLGFGSKRGVLQALADGLGTDAGEPDTRAIGGSLDEPHLLLALVAQLYRRLYERGNDVIVLLREGAASEPDLRAAVEAGLGRSRRSVGELCQRLDELGALRPGLSVDEAAGHALVLLSHDGYDELVVRRRWGHDAYEAWLAAALDQALLAPTVPAPEAGRGAAPTPTSTPVAPIAPASPTPDERSPT
jgi:AcrR family transcriptional regulator